MEIGDWAIRLLPFALTLALYGISLTFPLYWDDAANFNFFNGRSFVRLWTDASGFPYYRPALFTVWKFIDAVFGRGNTVLLHALNLTSHAANGLLAGQVARRLSKGSAAERWSLAAIASAASVLYPFAPLSVNLVASLFHLFLLTVSLAAVLAFVEWRRTGRLRWSAAGLALCAIAPFIHEAGIMVGPICAAALWSLTWPNVGGRQWALGGLATIASGLFLPVWLSVPKAREGGFAWVGWESIRQSTVFFFEGFTFPVQPLARPLMRLTGWDDMTSILAVGLPALFLSLWLLWRGGHRRVAALALAWYWLAALPSILVLGFWYIVTSTRLMVFPSGGAVLFWAFALVAAARQASADRRVQLAALSAGAVLILAVPAFHILREESLHARALAPIWDLARIARAHPGQRQLIVNPLDWYAPKEATYALGHEGVEVKASYVSLDDLALINGAEQPALNGAHFEPIKPLLEEHYYAVAGEAVDPAALAGGLAEYAGIWNVYFSDEGVVTRRIGQVTRGDASVPSRYLARFDEGTYLLEAGLSVTGRQSEISLSWLFLGPNHDGVAFAHVFDCAGNVLALADHPPLLGTYPFSLAQAGDRIHETRHARLDAVSPDGCYALEAGVFNPADGQRLPALSPGGERLPNDLVTVYSK